MRYLIIGSSLRGMDDAARIALSEGAHVALFDTERPGVPDGVPNTVDVLPSEWRADFLDGIDRVIASPWFSDRIPPLSDAIERGVPVVTEAGFGLERLSAPRIAITGTNGKTTVTEVVAEMLQASGIRAVAAGNVGRAVSSLTDDDGDVVVLELSSYQLRFLPVLRADACAILNIAPDHMDWHGTMDRYIDAKARIFDDAAEGAIVVYDADDPIASAVVARADRPLVPCSGRHMPHDGNGVDGDSIVIGDRRFETGVDDPTYRFDLVAAASLAIALGATDAGVAGVVANFEPGRHRREMVGEIDGVIYINDSKATNPHAAVAAAQAYDRVVLLVGGRNKGLDLTPLTQVPTVKALIAFGESAASIAAIAPETVRVAGNLSEAFSLAIEAAKPGDTVLLSPGCASFDEFESYGQRGDAFRDLVHEHGGVAA